MNGDEMKRPLSLGIVMLLPLTLLMGAEPARTHRCKPVDGDAPRRVVEQEEVPDLRIIERAPVELPPGCVPATGKPVRYEYEVLIDEKGEVECALLVNTVEGVSPCVMKAITKAVGYSRFSEPKDAKGLPVACYYLLVFESDLK